MLKTESTGALLQQNLFNEWLKTITISKDLSVFPSLDGISETFNFAKEICSGVPPFAVAQYSQKCTQSLEDIVLKRQEKIDFQDYFESGTILECCIFLASSDATQFFHQWQRERKMWWRKFSAFPGKYSLTDIRNGDNVQSVDITAKYSWGDQLLESLTLKNDYENISSDDLKVKDGKNDIQLQCLVSKTNLSTMLLNTLCDAHDEPLFEGNSRPLFRFHRKLAPYKISFSISATPKANLQELKDLALYLCRQLRKNNISCLYFPSSYQNSLEIQWKQYDQMGIPFNVVLQEDTIKTGVAFLRSRDTTLKEQIHVSDLSQYVEQLFQNY